MKALLSIVMLALVSVTPTFAASNLDLVFNFGTSLGQSGGVEDIGAPSRSTGIGFNYFFKPTLGLGFSYSNESPINGTEKIPTIDDGSISTVDLHLAMRYIKQKFHVVFEPGLGFQTIYNTASDEWGYSYSDPISTGLILNYKLFARYMVKEWASDPDTSGSFFVGAGIIHNFSFNDDYNGNDISGSRLAGVLQIGVGW